MLNILLFWSTYFGGIYAAFTRAPVFAFMVYQAVYFYNPPKRWWGDSIPTLSYSFYMVALMATLLALNWEKLKHNKLLEVPQTKWIYLFLILHLIASLYAVLPVRHEIFTTYFLKLVITISIAYKLINTRQDLYLAISGYVFGAWYLSFYTYQIGRNSGDRVEGIGTVDSPDSNGIAATLAPAVVFGIYYLWRSPNWMYRTLSLIILAFLCNALILINSRGAVLGVAVGGMYMMYDLYKSKLKGKYQRATVVGLCLIGLVGLSVVADDTFIERFSSIKEESAGVKEEEETGSSRIVYWAAAYQLALDHPFGTGAYGFNFYSSQYIPETTFVGRQLRSTGGIKSVHSSWFSALAEVGFLGLFALLMIFLSCYLSAKKMKKYFFETNNINDYYLVTAMQGALLAFAVTMVFLDRHRAEVLYWLFLFFMAAHNVFLNKNKHSENPEANKDSFK
jgi:putative inorganic carbon (HCO3(-)) transporter